MVRGRNGCLGRDLADVFARKECRLAVHVVSLCLHQAPTGLVIPFAAQGSHGLGPGLVEEGMRHRMGEDVDYSCLQCRGWTWSNRALAVVQGSTSSVRKRGNACRAGQLAVRPSCCTQAEGVRSGPGAWRPSRALPPLGLFPAPCPWCISSVPHSLVSLPEPAFCRKRPHISIPARFWLAPRMRIIHPEARQPQLLRRARPTERNAVLVLTLSLAVLLAALGIFSL